MGRRTKERADDDCRSNDCHKHHDIIDGVDYYYRCKDHTKLLPDGKLCHNDQQCKSGNCHKHPPKRGEKDYENKCKPRTKSAALFAAPTNLASHSTKQFKLRGSDDLCLGVEDHQYRHGRGKTGASVIDLLAKSKIRLESAKRMTQIQNTS